ncbi:nucleotidyltransferase [Lacibacter luteus]|uniref:Nucleotidyltransferase n=1 Tax=Lacibacter luteus TaxID=2508719 RepID=A0A4Q1CDY4_9BACT|nr:nucleotidyltransferase [Lacibacter luteus]RXK57577.1 nucleotidyltransferase [Lacibacter luteus]
MARTIAEIHNEIIAAVQADATLGAELTSTSRVSKWRTWSYIVSFAIWVHEKLFDLFKQEVSETIATLKPHTAKWYASKALAYQHGFPLKEDSDQFDNTGYTDTQIEESRVVAYAAVVEQTDQYGRVFLRIKLARINGGDLAPLTAPQLAGVQEYFARIKDAGVKLVIESIAADSIKMNWRIYYDPLILDSTGSRTDGTAADVVKNAIKDYLKNLPFNGVYVLQYHIDALQQVEGITIPIIDLAQTKYGLLPFTNVNVKTTPDSGYLRFADDADLNITYIAQTPIV